MADRHPSFPSAASHLTVSDLEAHARGWILETEYSMRSKRTVENRKLVVEKLLWFLRGRGFNVCGAPEMKAFMAYLVTGHETPEGRWGNGKHPRLAYWAKRPMQASTVKAWHHDLRTLFNYLVREEVLAVSPLAKIQTPKASEHQIAPFTEEQVRALLAAAKKSRLPRRDEALVLFLLDTGARASEVCGLLHRDLDIAGKACRLHGKGNKERTVHLCPQTVHALWLYFKERQPEPNEVVFDSERGLPGEGMSRMGLLALIKRLGEAAGIEAVRCSPHTFRHTAAILWLRSGGDVFSLQEMLGHRSLKITARYVALAEADVAEKHRRHSPVEAVFRKRKP